MQHRALITLALACLYGCAATKSLTDRTDGGRKPARLPAGGSQGAGSGSAGVMADWERFAGAAALPALALDEPIGTATAVEALSACDACQKRRGAWLARFGALSGALPEIFAPSVRDPIRTDKRLDRLDNVPFVGNVLGGFVTPDDDSVRANIRQGILARLGRAVPGATAGDARLDAFLALDGSAPRAMSLDEQTARWRLVMSLDNLWAGRAPLTGGNHGAQAFETMRTIMEWSYLFGLERGAAGNTYGGLTLDAAGNQTALAGAFDPRVDPDKKRYFAAKYAVSYAEGSLIDMARGAGELWTPAAGSVRLATQAKLWSAAAAAFARLRADQRGGGAGLFGAPGVALLPADAQAVPLAFLATMRAMLNGPFIDLTTHAIAGSARIGGGGGDPAGVEDLALLAEALAAWVDQISHLDGAGLTPDARNGVEGSLQSLRDALRLCTTTLAREHLRPAAGAGLELYDANGPVTDLAVAGHALSALARTGAGALKNDRAAEAAAGLAHWLRADAYPLATANGRLDAAAALWLGRGLGDALALKPEVLAAPWLPAFQKTVQDAAVAWDAKG